MFVHLNCLQILAACDSRSTGTWMRDNQRERERERERDGERGRKGVVQREGKREK